MNIVVSIRVNMIPNLYLSNANSVGSKSLFFIKSELPINIVFSGCINEYIKKIYNGIIMVIDIIKKNI